MTIKNRFEKNKEEPFSSYSEYMEFLFACVNLTMRDHINDMKEVYATGNGDYKNVLYPDLEIAFDSCQSKLDSFSKNSTTEEEETPEDSEETSAGGDEFSDELGELLAAFSTENAGSAEADSQEKGDVHVSRNDVVDMLENIEHRAELTTDISLPFRDLCLKLELDEFSRFSFVCGLLAATQTSYASTFQVINQNSGLPIPTMESAARLFYGRSYNPTEAFGPMSECLEKLRKILDMQVHEEMPFATAINVDKRIIDYLFGKHPEKLDDRFDRFFTPLSKKGETLDPVLANDGDLDAIKIAFEDGIRIIAINGDVGSGRKFFVKHFCEDKGETAITMDCKKLFGYDVSFVEKALWAVNRECVLLNACCVLDSLEYHQEDKDHFFSYLDLALTKLRGDDITVFLVSMDEIPLKEATHEDFATRKLDTPSVGEREKIWNYFREGYNYDADVSTEEMAAKFLFTPGKIKSAIHLSKSLASQNKEITISRNSLFKACYAQMSSELSQKATRVEAKFSFDDIVMNPTQRETLQHAIDQMTYRKEVYENWNYTKKYPYGRGLSVLLFGAPGTGKSMCAQVIAHELNLELYRVDLSKVIDKYVGETEKSISMIFREAKKCNVVLFFDECDTLFAKRSDDGGSNQSSNNNKTALLLQEVEAYDGVSVLATNYKHNIDPAFFRRMKYIVEFQFPDPETRYVLWNTTIPKSTPLAEDVDLRFIADRFEFVGGNIKNCILNAAFLAAADPEANGEVGMKHYLQAIKYEFVKTGKVFTKADFEPYASLVGL